MDLRSLRTFVAVVEHGSFTAAAAALGYTQPAVSQQVGALEAALGVRLFERRPFALTPAAARLAEHAGNILLRVDVATSELAAIERPAATVVAATPLAAATAEVARLLAAGARAEGAAHAELAVTAAGDVAARVARRECAAGVVDGIVGPRDPLARADPGLLTALVLRTAPLAVALPDGHPLAGGPRWSGRPSPTPAGSTPRASPRRPARARRRWGTGSRPAPATTGRTSPPSVPSWRPATAWPSSRGGGGPAPTACGSSRSPNRRGCTGSRYSSCAAGPRPGRPWSPGLGTS